MLHAKFQDHRTFGSGEDFLVLTQMTGTSVVFSLLEGEMSRIWYQNDQ